MSDRDPHPLPAVRLRGGDIHIGGVRLSGMWIERGSVTLRPADYATVNRLTLTLVVGEVVAEDITVGEVLAEDDD